MANKKGKTIGIFSAKGGVGKTIMTINLAGIAESLKRKTLIIDLDITSGAIAVALNREPKKNIYDFVKDTANNYHQDFKEYVTNYSEYIDFLASPKDPRQGAKMDGRYMELLLDQATYLYDVILIDMNHHLDDINLTTLDLVNKVLFLVTNDPLDLKNMKSLISIFKDLEINKYKVLLNNSVNITKDYFNLYDLKAIIKTNVDYTLTNKFFISNIDTYIMNGDIITLIPKASSTYGKDYNTLMTIMVDMLGNGGKSNG